MYRFIVVAVVALGLTACGKLNLNKKNAKIPPPAEVEAYTPAGEVDYVEEVEAIDFEDFEDLEDFEDFEGLEDPDGAEDNAVDP